MAWIESNQALANHPKTKRFARMAGISIPAALGHLHLLWWWALDYAQDGDLTVFEPEDIADAVLWDGPADVIVRALIDSRFIDFEDGVSKIHDWMDYAGRLIDKRRANTERKRKSRTSHARQTQDKEVTSVGQAADVIGTDDGTSRDVQFSHGATVHNSTVPNQTEQNQEESEKARERLLPLFNSLGIKGGGALGLDKVYSYIGVVDVEVIELALKAAEGKHVNYFVSTINGWISEGKTTAALVNHIPPKGEFRGNRSPSSGASRGGASRRPTLPVVTSDGPSAELSDEERKRMRELARSLRDSGSQSDRSERIV